MDERWRRVVFGDDGSPGAFVARTWIAAQPWEGWALDIVTAVAPPFPPRPDDEASTLREMRELPQDGDPMFGHAGFARIRHLQGTGDPRVVLGSVEDADLLVVGSAGDHQVAHMLGSTSEWLAHHPPAPLLVAHGATSVGHVVACVDGSTHAQRAVEAFAALPLARGTSVCVLSVYDGWSDARQGVARASATLEQAGAHVEEHEERGHAGWTIVREVRDRHPDLVVLGTRGMTGWRGVLLGSTASRVVRSSPASCLVATASDD